MNNSELLLYQTEDGQTKIDVRLEEETVWLSQAQIVELFQTTKQNISLHIRNIFKEGELDEISVVKDYFTTASDGKKYSTNFYNLDVVISVGYRVKSHRGTQFRIWATKQLKEYILTTELMLDNMDEKNIREELAKTLSNDPQNFDKILKLSHNLVAFDKDNVRFLVDSGVIYRLGKELVARHETAVSELVKNAYDADASLASLNFINVDY